LPKPSLTSLSILPDEEVPEGIAPTPDTATKSVPNDANSSVDPDREAPPIVVPHKLPPLRLRSLDPTPVPPPPPNSPEGSSPQSSPPLEPQEPIFASRKLRALMDLRHLEGAGTPSTS
jgi:hypothetical protein